MPTQTRIRRRTTDYGVTMVAPLTLDSIDIHSTDLLASRGYPLFYGAMGENLTTEGIDHRTWRAGQRYRLGNDVLIELTQPRGPCTALHVYGAELPAAPFRASIR